MLPIALSRTPAAASRRQRQPIRRNALRDRDACTSFVPIAVQFPLIAWESDVVPRATAAIASNPAPHARYHVASIICYHNVVVQVELVDSNNGSSRHVFVRVRAAFRTRELISGFNHCCCSTLRRDTCDQVHSVYNVSLHQFRCSVGRKNGSIVIRQLNPSSRCANPSSAS